MATKKFTSKLDSVDLDLAKLKYNQTSRGAPCLMYENYKFRFGNRMKDEIRWRCTNKMCKATIKTKGDVVSEQRTEHDHEPYPPIGAQCGSGGKFKRRRRRQGIAAGAVLPSGGRVMRSHDLVYMRFFLIDRSFHVLVYMRFCVLIKDARFHVLVYVGFCV